MPDSMRSSYNNSLSYCELLRVIVHLENPRNIVEFGILDGASLLEFASSGARVKAYDIFENFQGNHAKREDLAEKFKNFSNVEIDHGDFYKKYEDLNDGSIDILHVDIANNGDVYRFCFEHYLKKLRDGGLLILEGGSAERDNVEWMNKYAKPKMAPVLSEYSQLRPITVGKVPSITFIRASQAAISDC